MFEQHFANYLLKKQRISESQHALVTKEQTNARVKLGLIAVAEKLITSEQAEKLNALQRQSDRRFGDLAVENGLLSTEQIDGLLAMQGNSYLRLIQILTENDFLSLEELENLLHEYQEEKGFSDNDVQVLKSGDLQSILPLLIRTEDVLATNYISLALRNIIRFIHNQPLLGEIKKVTSYSSGNLAFQDTTGDHNLWLGFASEGDELTEIASPFAKEDFAEMNEDAFDSVCEFINCINGLFSSELSFKDVIVDMQPPSFAQNQDLRSANGIYVVPITINGRHVDLLATIDDQLQLGMN